MNPVQSKVTPQTLVTPTSTSILLITTYETFFGTYPLPQVFDQTNPLTQTVHGRKVSCLGPGGLTARTAIFRAEIFIQVTMGVFAQLTRLKTSMLDLLDP
jgi:DNA-directed RNA polymerase beta subunit